MSIFDQIIESSNDIINEILKLLELSINFLKTIGKMIIRMDKPIQIFLLLLPILPILPIILNFLKDF